MKSITPFTSKKQMISERYILLPCLEGCSKSRVFTVLHNKVPAS